MYSEHRRLSSVHGFTLIEIMVVVVIIGLLAAIVSPIVIDRLDEATVLRVEQDLRGTTTALNLFRIEHFRYPTTEEGLAALTGESPLEGERITGNGERRAFLENLPRDPWGNPYLYERPSQHGKDYDLYTLGADGREGGDGLDADIGNWSLD